MARTFVAGFLVSKPKLVLDAATALGFGPSLQPGRDDRPDLPPLRLRAFVAGRVA
jgi:hypothetical protein